MNSNPDLILLNLHKTPTHFSTVHNSFSTIDLSFSSSSLSPSLTWKTHSQLCDSDNFPILISHISPQSPPHKSLPKWNLSEVDWSQFFHLTSQTKLLSTSDSIEQDIISFINFVIEAADQTILKIPAQSNNRRVHWCSSEVKIALQDRNRGFNNFHKTRNFSDLINYKWLRAKARCLLCFAKKESWNTFVSSINDPVSCSTMWSNMRKLEGVKQKFTLQPLIHQNQVYESPPEISELLAFTYAKISANTRRTGLFSTSKK